MGALQQIIILLLCHFTLVYGYKILVTSLGVSDSQNVNMARITDILADRGHDVTLFWWSLFPTDKVKLKKSKEIRSPLTTDMEFMDKMHGGAAAIVWKSIPTNLPIGLLMIISQTPDGCKNFLENDNTINHMKAEKYDLILVHMFDGCSYGLAHVLGVKTVAAFSTAFMSDPMAWHSGSSAPVSIVPSFTNPVTDKMGFFDRLNNLFFTGTTNFAFDWINRQYTYCFREKYGKNFPSVQSLMKETQLYLLNSEPFFEYPKPTLHNILYVGGLTMQNPDPLTEKWQKIVDKARPKGIVLFSLGTVANTTTMPEYIKKALFNGFKRFPDYTFICKMIGEFPEAKSIPNVHISEWLPQLALLGNPKVKTFITHGGYNSLMESVFLGVPLIVLPLFGDQAANAMRVKRIGVGVILDKMTLSEQQVYDGLHKVLEEKGIQENAKRIGKMIQNKPVSSLDLAMKWLEFLAEYKTLDILKPESRHMGLIEYYMIDVLLFLFVLLAFTCFIFLKCASACWRKIRSSKQKKE